MSDEIKTKYADKISIGPVDDYGTFAQISFTRGDVRFILYDPDVLKATGQYGISAERINALFKGLEFYTPEPPGAE